MKYNFLKTTIVSSLAAWMFSACGSFNPGPVPEDITGDTPGELQAKIADLLKQAGSDSSKVEFAEITSMFQFRPGDNFSHVSIQIVSPEDKDKMVQYDWTDMKDRRNVYEVRGLTVSSNLGTDVIDTYDGYKDMLFSYEDARPYLTNLPAYCKEALEASGYKDKGYISSFTIDVEGANIGVSHKDASTISKTFRISADKLHIEKHD